jgi:hypothetical protein
MKVAACALAAIAAFAAAFLFLQLGVLNGASLSSRFVQLPDSLPPSLALWADPQVGLRISFVTLHPAPPNAPDCPPQV